MRLDCYLVEQGLAPSRSKAHEMIEEGSVVVNGKVVLKSSLSILNQEVIVTAIPYVSRSALKLKGFLEQTSLRIRDKKCLDVGASTGGFTQVLLEFGAQHVTAIDVGSDQFDSRLASHERISVYEKTDIRRFEHSPFDLVVCDVSFISLNCIIDDLIRLCGESLIVLFKPQFEVGKEAKRDKRGCVIDTKAIETAQRLFKISVQSKGLLFQQCLPAKIKGKEGNQEFVYYFSR